MSRVLALDMFGTLLLFIAPLAIVLYVVCTWDGDR